MEYLDICGEDGMPTGETVSRDEAHRLGVLHRTAHVWITRENRGVTEVLLQKRSMEKDSFPGMYDTSSAGHIPAGSEPVPSALRELREELGISAEPNDLAYAGSFRAKYEKVFHGSLFRDNEYVFVYVLRRPVDIGDIVVQRSEIDEVRWFSLGEVEDAASRGSKGVFCVPPGGIRVVRGFLAEGGK